MVAQRLLGNSFGSIKFEEHITKLSKFLFVIIFVEALARASILWSLNGWCWVMTIIGFGRRLLNFNHRYLKTSNELVLPFYILHETVIVAIAFYAVNLKLLVILKFLIIVLASFIIINLLLLPIKHIKILRFLFGMNPKK